ncbi:unnamed protein product [Linum trigynum]|uniref:Myb/SANT-like domain-containing protein n=1 Tax=Linum trigynum TaxID=586398 RepID=A0AAV2DZG8_9ROSI
MVEMTQRHQVENGSFKNGAFFRVGEYDARELVRNQSGCGWNNVTKTPTLDDDVFEALIKVHPNYKNLNRKPFPFYDELLKTPIDVEGQRIESFMEDLINEGIEISQRAAVTPPAQPIQGASNSDMKKKAIKKENKTDNAIVAVAEELGGLKPIISKALDALGSIVGDSEEEDDREAALMAEIGKIQGLECWQVLDAGMTLVENDRKTRFFYALDNEEDKKYFIQNLLR